jgi:hypothetical protein
MYMNIYCMFTYFVHVNVHVLVHVQVHANDSWKLARYFEYRLYRWESILAIVIFPSQKIIMYNEWAYCLRNF